MVWPNLVLAKLGLAKLGLGQTWSGQTWSWPNLDLAKLGLARSTALQPSTSSRSSPNFSELRFRLPLHVTDAQCECGSMLDRMGRHRAACPRSGRRKIRALPTERTLARVYRKAGATGRRDVKLWDMNIFVQSRIEVLAMGLPIQQGAQLAVDITLRPALGAMPKRCDHEQSSASAQRSKTLGVVGR